MSVRLYVGNLPQSFDAKELDALFTSVGEGIRFKAVQDRETGAGRGFGFANVDDEKVADAVIEQLNGREFGGNALRIERSERRDERRGNEQPRKHHRTSPSAANCNRGLGLRSGEGWGCLHYVKSTTRGSQLA